VKPARLNAIRSRRRDVFLGRRQPGAMLAPAVSLPNRIGSLNLLLKVR
jgi:hypothetical protein